MVTEDLFKPWTDPGPDICTPQAVYSAQGAFLSSSFSDYLIPGTTEGPLVLVLVPVDLGRSANPEGVKGVGESGTIPVAATIASAVEAALRRRRPDLKINHIPMAPSEIFELMGDTTPVEDPSGGE